jgi:nucleoside-diphosphate kinase
MLVMLSSTQGWADAEKPQVQQTLSIIKPDAVAQNHIGGIIAKIETGGLKVVGIKMIKLSIDQAQQFYAVHKDRPFFNDLTTYMASGPIVVQVLEGVNAIEKYREITGATDPKRALPGTIRAEFGSDVQQNAVHGSDSVENAKAEISFFFKPNEIFTTAK